MECGGSSRREEDVSSESFFPRCFDLSDSSQLEDFKEDFRQTAAAVVLKMSGWREDYTGQEEGAPPSNNGAKSLTDREWEALLMSSYSLRKVAVGATTVAHGKLSDDGRESKELLKDHGWGSPAGVGVGAWSPSRIGQSRRDCPHDVREEQEWESETGYVSQLALEAKQLCATFERRCPQWTMDGERNLWVLKPAGASRGQGVRVAWTLDQILCAQQTMGGRVVQKYVETTLLLPRTSPPPRRLPNDSALLGQGIHRRRRLELEYGEEEKARGNSHDTCETVETVETVEKVEKVEKVENVETVKTGWGKSNVVDKEPTIWSGKIGSPSGGREDDTRRHAGDTEQTDIDLGASVDERKFDIRTWVLVTGWEPLEAFVFDEGYLRVCPQSFTLDESKFAEPKGYLRSIYHRR
eukprot:g8007.t1